MRPLTRGIRIAIIELAITIKQRKKKRPSRFAKGRKKIETSAIPTPVVISDHM
jgi:hypothetical protein